MSFNLKKYVNHLIAFFVITHGIILDQITKGWAARHLVPGKPTEIISGFFNLGLVRNRGAVFGIGNTWDPFWRKFFFLGLTFVAIIVIIWILCKHIKGPKFFVLAVSMILAGALSNFYDRLVMGYVVDFLEFSYRSFTWPNFNVADAFITVGVVLYIIYSIFLDRGRSGVK